MRILPILALVFLSTLARTQSSDDCAQPTTVVGPGPHAFDNRAAVPAPESEPCGPVSRDVWFHWVAPTSGYYSVRTCAGTDLDTVVAAYVGSTCTAGGLAACNDDSCGTQSSVSFLAQAGQDFTIQIASRGTNSAGGTGTFGILVGAACSATVGPDLIVGNIGGVQNYSLVGSVDSIALGSDLCNVGDLWADMDPNTNRHPVWGGSLYRYRVVSGAGRFEQIGMSWVRHGFFALSQSLCCPSCSATDGSHLGVGCSDPQTASGNGTQSWLGPRRQLDAATGDFAYPPANPTYTGAGRRIQIPTADIDVSPGVRWFGEVHVVSPDDAQAGNGHNNASFRELTTTGTTWATTSVTERERSAIEAWLSCDSGVALVDVDVPGDGRFQVASKVTDLGGGQWHYEYAVHNLNSHRSGGEFSIPVGGAALTNIGFHDVAYNSGDGEGNVTYSGADWVGLNVGGVLTWTTETQAQNVNANALRWGTTYNFRFDANVPPVAGVATLGLWRAGSPTSMPVSVDVPGAGGPLTAYCFGDGTSTACPCGNFGSAGHGCANSVSPEGGRLSATGTASIAADTLVLQAAWMPNSSALYFQGTTSIAGVLGDGLRCAGGNVIRLGTQTNAAGSSSYPGIGDTTVSVRGACAAGDLRVYQCWYRNAADFCTPSTFNLTNVLAVSWSP